MTEEISIVEDKEYLRVTIKAEPDTLWEKILRYEAYEQEFIGRGTCWYFYPSFKLAGTMNCYRLSGICEKFKYERDRSK